MNNDNSNSGNSFFKVNEKGSQEKLSWLESKLKALKNDMESSTSAQIEFIRAYASADNAGLIGTNVQAYGPRKRDSIKKTRTPFIADLTNAKVAQMAKSKADINVIARHGDYSDRGAAIASKLVCRNILEQQKFDNLMVEAERMRIILGEIYINVKWNPDIGDLYPLYIEAKNQGITSFKTLDNRVIDLKNPLHIGDVELSIDYPWNYLIEQRMSSRYCDARYGFHISYVDRDELEEDYPEAAKYTSNSIHQDIYDVMIRQALELDRNEVPVYEFYHKKTKYLPQGKYIKFIDGVILEESDCPYEHGDFPWERYTDIEVPKFQNGISRYFHVLPMQKRLDDLTLIADLNNYRAGQGKWIYQEGSMKPEDLGYAGTYASFRGPIPPQYVTVTPSSPQLLQRIEMLRENMTAIFGAAGISKDTLPPGVTAFSAIQLVSQLENERATPELQKRGEVIVGVCKKILSTAGQFYKPDDGRLIRILGNDNAYTIKHFDVADLNKPYDIKFENSNGFPESEPAKNQRLQAYAQQLPDIMSPAEWMHRLGLNDEDGAIDAVTEAIKCAESENEDFLTGGQVAPPDETEDLIIHHKIHFALFQKRSFREEASNEAMDRAKEHLFQTEELMILKSQNNPHYAAQLATVPNFPVFPHANYQPPMSQEHAAMVAQGQANRGEPMSTMVPAQPNPNLK
jgi:hypothetical protein